MACIAATVAGFIVGGRFYSQAMVNYRSLESSLEEREAELSESRQEIVNLQIADKVNRLTQERLREKVTELQTNLVELEGEVYLYKNLVEDDDGDIGLNLESLTLYSTLEPGTFQYRIVVRRKAALSQAIEVSLSLSIEGKMLGAPFSLPFHGADPSVEEDTLAIRFKYFKVLQGTFVLPEGFLAEKVVLSMYESGRADSLVIKELPWKVSEF